MHAPLCIHPCTNACVPCTYIRLHTTHVHMHKNTHAHTCRHVAYFGESLHLCNSECLYFKGLLHLHEYRWYHKNKCSQLFTNQYSFNCLRICVCSNGNYESHPGYRTRPLYKYIPHSQLSPLCSTHKQRVGQTDYGSQSLPVSCLHRQ